VGGVDDAGQPLDEGRRLDGVEGHAAQGVLEAGAVDELQGEVGLALVLADVVDLHHAGVLARQKALVLGDFAQCSAENTQRYPYSMDEVVDTLRLLLPYPVLTQFPFGHIARKATLPFGGQGTLQLHEGGYSLRFGGHLKG